MLAAPSGSLERAGRLGRGGSLVVNRIGSGRNSSHTANVSRLADIPRILRCPSPQVYVFGWGTMYSRI